MEAHSEAQDGKGWNRFHLFEDMGGSEGVGKLVDIIFTNSAADPLLASYFDGVDVKKLIAAAVVYLSSALGGPSPWTGRSLVEIHKNIGVTEEAVQRFANIAVNAALECGSCPEDAENLRKAILSMAP
jgi:hemoglobin